ncbi:cupin domain-containing protein [uncultured Sanguibacteroides sp.]|uniref:cupin domain-containing protein n=1 Tax=uncultured Sanguibacteroides sp. TaxID=1635151 RepID=UPI0025E02F51|nr:cupin domain-containing protein [uncultured Sanguibacteroides sp.]
MITKKENAKSRQFKGVSFDVLAVGEKSMVTKMNYKVGDRVPPHAHPNEQSGYVISGKYRIVYQEEDEILTSGDSYSIPENIVHAWEVIEGGEVIDVFTPFRTDYL